MLITSPTVTFETSPFQVTESTPQLCMHILVKELGKSFIIYTQRYKPLPAIGSTTDLPPHLPGDHSRPDPPSSKPGIVSTVHCIMCSVLDVHCDYTVISDPPVTVCVRLPDGGRCEVTLPLSSPLSSLVAAAFSDGGRQQEAPGGVVKQGGPEGQGWVLCTSEVPKRELRNLSLSLQETGLTTPCILHLVPS